MHVDLDAFYAAVEEREHPEYKGKPVVVGADPKQGQGRGVVSTCNYEARRFGIRSGMPISKAWRLNKTAIFLPVSHELYGEVSSRVMQILRSHADKFEQVSIDEAFLDVSEKAESFEQARKLAQSIKDEILRKEKLTCSIGIGPNKLVAKIASDFQKPDGLTIVEEKNVKAFLAPLTVDKIPGVGRKTAQRMNMLDVRTIGELTSSNVLTLREEFGVSGIAFRQMAQGIDRSDVIDEYTPRSFSREHTFEEDTADEEIIFETVDELLEEVIRETMESGFSFKTLTTKIRYQDFKTHTHSRTMSLSSVSLDSLRQIAHELVNPFLSSKRKIRLIGIRTSNLVSQHRQETLVK
jgi:DNA polymerase IV (DinB-like DNA polymerase)